MVSIHDFHPVGQGSNPSEREKGPPPSPMTNGIENINPLFLIVIHSQLLKRTVLLNSRKMKL